MLVRLAVAWTGPGGVVHGAGELVDVDAVTLAELEEQDMVEKVNSPNPKTDQPDLGTDEPEKGTEWVGPGSTEPEGKADAGSAWVGPGSTDPN